MMYKKLIPFFISNVKRQKVDHAVIIHLVQHFKLLDKTDIDFATWNITFYIYQMYSDITWYPNHFSSSWKVDYVL